MKSSKESRPQAEPPSIVLQPSRPETVQWELQQIQLGIARRAYELFEARNLEHGHDWEDWFRAESELVRPVSIAISESPNSLSVRVNVLGFEADEIQTAIEPTRITIVGRKKLITPTEGKTVSASDFYPDQLGRTIDASAEIDPEGAVVELQSGVLKFELPKAVKPEVGVIQAA